MLRVQAIPVSLNARILRQKCVKAHRHVFLLDTCTQPVSTHSWIHMEILTCDACAGLWVWVCGHHSMDVRRMHGSPVHYWVVAINSSLSLTIQFDHHSVTCMVCICFNVCRCNHVQKPHEDHEGNFANRCILLNLTKRVCTRLFKFFHGRLCVHVLSVCMYVCVCLCMYVCMHCVLVDVFMSFASLHVCMYMWHIHIILCMTCMYICV